ncbi:ARM repeat-containing protein [Basidiobolus meristosporus CBS 931.73]|uniref:ARM repeat-containing protein n=1 Tax=Basidiobolus meristosporus CBS 931.73 TaxID=1314790 RepID=A0A1Y1XSN0_9FUNG|nr:ARM repeat-containing protein [Basidiobolus meristosporus CBS 931.73]|eukprot:ORX88733.1 ARM repeat-containing protein [Basidiobolus meristosporus CBS 931.73]
MIKMMATLAEFSDLDSVVDIFVPLLVQMASDPTFNVRKEVPVAINSVIKVVSSQHAVDDLLLQFEHLANDDIWQVRKSCALVLPEICASVPASAQLEICLPIFKAMISDVSRWVQTCVEDGLGRMVAAFAGGDVPDDLIEKYISLFPNKSSMRDPDRTLRCAFNFPAVLLALGPHRWPEFANDYSNLCRDTQMSVRRTLAYSLHEIAKLLRENVEACDKQLAPLFGFFMMDADEVRVGVLQNAATFLGCLSLPTREMYLPVLEDIWEADSKNWRVRELVAQQIPPLCELFSATTIVNDVLPIAIKCLNDPVFRVRETAVSAIPIIYGQTKKDPDLSSQIFETILQFGLSASFRKRMIFVQICRELLQTSQIAISIFGEVLMPVFSQLSSDKVANVRLLVIQATETLINAFHENEQECSPKFQEQLGGLLKRFSSDDDPEIQSTLSQSILPSIEIPLSDPSPIDNRTHHGPNTESNGKCLSKAIPSRSLQQYTICQVDENCKPENREAEENVRKLAKRTEEAHITEPVKITRVVSGMSNSKPLDLVDSL